MGRDSPAGIESRLAAGEERNTATADRGIRLRNSA
jgi:hypothetical protein